MTIHRIVRMVAGSLVLLGLALSQLASPWWLLLVAFVGTNLLQSALTDFCPLMSILRRLGVPESPAAPARR